MYRKDVMASNTFQIPPVNEFQRLFWTFHIKNGQWCGDFLLLSWKRCGETVKLLVIWDGMMLSDVANVIVMNALIHCVIWGLNITDQPAYGSYFHMT